jgi:hypothetical protein
MKLKWLKKAENILAKLIQDIQVPVEKSLGIPRRNMPQIKKKHLEDYMDWIKEKDVKISETKILAKDLKPTQKDFNIKKVKQFMDSKDKLDKPLLVSKDNYIIDGHHKWLANLNLDDNKKLKVIQVDLTAKQLLKETMDFDKVKYKDVKDNSYKKIDPKLKHANRK